MGPLWLAERRGPSNQNKTKAAAAGEQGNSGWVFHKQCSRWMPQGRGRQWSSSPAFPHRPCLFPQGVQVCGQKLCADIPKARHFSGAHQEPPGGAELPLPPLWQGLPLTLRPGCASVLTQPPAPAQPQEGQCRLQVRALPFPSPCREPRGLVPWWFWLLRTSGTSQRGIWGSRVQPGREGSVSWHWRGQEMLARLISFFNLADSYPKKKRKKILKKGSQCSFLVHNGKKICFFSKVKYYENSTPSDSLHNLGYSWNGTLILKWKNEQVWKQNLKAKIIKIRFICFIICKI